MKTLGKGLTLGIISIIITLITAIIGRSATQIVDYIRRVMEAISMLVSYLMFKHNLKETSQEKIDLNNRRVHIIVNVALLVSGVLMVFIGIAKYKLGFGYRNVVPGFVASLLGVFCNSYFVFKYTRSLKEHYEPIIKSQCVLYITKLTVDTCVTSAMFVMIKFPNWEYSNPLDALTSIVVAIILCTQGIINLRNGNGERG